MEKGYYRDALKIIEFIIDRDEGFSDETIETISPHYGIAILKELESSNGVTYTCDGWFTNNTDALHLFRAKCKSELESIINKEIEKREHIIEKEEQRNNRYWTNVREWVAIMLSAISTIIALWAFCRTF